MCYNLSVSVHADKIRAEKLKTYAKNRKLIDGLDPYFDEHFPPDLVLDFGTDFYGNMYGGSGRYPCSPVSYTHSSPRDGLLSRMPSSA